GAGFLLVTRVFDSPEKPFTLLIEAWRKGDELIIQFAWRVYHNEVRIPDSKEPLATLRAFAEVYGMAFRSPTTQEMVKFVEYDVMSAPAGSWPQYVDVESGKIRWVAHQIVKQAELQGTWRIGTAFAINMDLYAASLKKRGVRVRPFKKK